MDKHNHKVPIYRDNSKLTYGIVKFEEPQLDESKSTQEEVVTVIIRTTFTK